MFKRYGLLCFYIFIYIGIIILNISYRKTVTNRTPQNTTSTYAIGHAGDFHEYLAFIKGGRDGHILYHNVFTEEPLPNILYMPFYSIAGLLSKPFAVTISDVYFYSHIFSLGLIFLSIYLLIKRICIRIETAWFASLCFFFSNAFWFVSSSNPLQLYLPINTYAFDLFLKYHAIPPHHSLAAALTVLVIFFIQQKTRRSYVFAAVLVALIGLLHPYIQIIALMIITGYAIFESLKQKTWRHEGTFLWSFVMALSAPGILYYVYLDRVILQHSTQYSGVLTQATSFFPLKDYLFSLGPLLPLSLGIFLNKKIWNMPAVFPLMIWGYGTIVLFTLPPFGIPIITNQWRLFQSYQHIPFAILAALSVQQMFKSKQLLRLSTFLFALLLIWYGGFYYLAAYTSATKQDIGGYINLFVPNHLVDAYLYLNKNTPKDSVVLAGEFASIMLPEYTHNRVIIGHDYLNKDYYTKKAELYAFLDNVMPKEQVRALLHKYHVSYILFGGDAPLFTQSAYNDLPFLKEIYNASGNASVVEVLPEK